MPHLKRVTSEKNVYKRVLIDIITPIEMFIQV